MNAKSNTSTPGDLSARLLAYATRKAKARDALGVPAGDYVGQEEIDTLCQAAAALSALPVPPGYTTDRDGSIVPGSVYDGDERYDALPAAGGTDFASRFTESQARGWKAVCATLDEIDPDWILEGSTSGKTGVQRACDAIRRLATTPQPSAAEGRPLVRFKHGDPLTGRIKPIPSSAVGAQGDGWPALPWRDINGCPESDDLFWFRRGDTIDGPRPPAPDDADYWDWFAPCEAPSSAAPAAGKGVDDVNNRVCIRFVADDGSTHASPEAADRHNALTRQPVAGDGMVLVPREPSPEQVHAGTLTGILTPNQASAAYQAMLAAAPAATPTDGGSDHG